MTTRHSLDGVEFVASLVRHDPGLVSLWWTEWLISGYDWGVNPDHLVIIDTGEASALILVEVDESTERPPVIRERLHAYAKLFEDRRVGWHLLWVVNSPERLARLRQIAGPMKLPTLAGRCWGVAIGEVYEHGADAEVLAVGASQAPRPLRALATDPKARRTCVPVGSPAWVRLLANGGREDDTRLWNGVEREPGEAGTGEAAEVEATAIRSDQPDASEADAGPAISDPIDVNAGLEISRPGELVRVILDPTSAPELIQRGVELLVQRENWYDLFDVFEVLCRSGDQGRRLDGIQLIRRVRPAANGWLRRQSRELLLGLIDGQNEGAVVDAVLAALKEAASA